MRLLKKSLCLVLCCCAAVLSFSGCATAPKAQKRDYINTLYFDTVSTFYDYSGLEKGKFEQLCDEVEKQLRSYHELYDIYNEYDGIVNIATLNRLAGCGAQKVDARIIGMLSFAKEMYNLTSGKVNIAMGAVLKIWHEYRSEGEDIPPMQLLKSASEHTDINDLIIDGENMTVELRDPEMSLDVGAVAKGYAVEMIAASLEEIGYSACVLDVGGNLRAIGEKPDGSGWTVGVRNPDLQSSESYVHKTELKNGALVTSGSYQRFYTVGGIRYHHIINDKTLMPENYYFSVSVRSDSSAFSDALSTAIFNMEYEEAKSFISGLRGVTVILVLPDGTVEVLE